MEKEKARQRALILKQKALILSDHEIEVAAKAYQLACLEIPFEDFLAARLAGTNPDDRVRVERVGTRVRLGRPELVNQARKPVLLLEEEDAA